MHIRERTFGWALIALSGIALSGCAGQVPPPPEPVPLPEPAPPPAYVPPPEPEPTPSVPTVASIRVDGAGAAIFYYLPAYVLSGIPGTEAQKMAQVRTGNAFGPHYGPAFVDVLVGTNYVFLPECGGQLSWARRKPGSQTAKQAPVVVALSCQ